MTRTTPLSRRKMLGRIGLLAVAGYSVPALTTLSMAQAASSGASGGSASAGSAASASVSAPSSSTPSASVPSGPSKAAVCGVEDLNSPAYLKCLVDNGFV